MKESELTSSEDLDAGWDVSDSSPPATSTHQPRSASWALADELDAGWDSAPAAVPEVPAAASMPTGRLEQPERPRTSEVRELAKVAAKPKPVVQTAATPPSHVLTKKERRQLERQQRAHAAQKQAEAKAAKRQQRKQASVTAAPQLAASSSSPVTTGPNSRVQTKASRRAKQNKKPEQHRAEPQPKSKLPVATVQRTNATAQSHPAPAMIPEPERQHNRMLRFVGFGALLIVLVALIWFFARK